MHIKFWGKRNIKPINKKRETVIKWLIILDFAIWAIVICGVIPLAVKLYNNIITPPVVIIHEADAMTVSSTENGDKNAVNATVASTEDIIREVAAKNDFKDVNLLIAIAKCESGLKYRNINVNSNGTEDVGLYQFNSIHKFGEKPLDPYWATQKAIDWIRAGKLHAWSASKSCWMK